MVSTNDVVQEAVDRKFWPGNLRAVLNYSEQDPKRGSITQKPIRAWDTMDKDVVLAYMNLPVHYRIATMCIEDDIDLFTNEAVSLSHTNNHLTANHDGQWFWTKMLPYYIEKYDIDIEEDFIEHAYEQLGIDRVTRQLTNVNNK